MTTPDRLEQVLTELEALHHRVNRWPNNPPYCPECSSVINDTLVEWPCSYAFLFAKLRAAMEMEPNLRCERIKLRTSPNCLQAHRYPCPSCAALVAWQQAGEE